MKIQNASATLVQAWKSSGLSSDGSHVLATPGDEQSWALPYNLYADRLLRTNLLGNAVSYIPAVNMHITNRLKDL